MLLGVAPNSGFIEPITIIEAFGLEATGAGATPSFSNNCKDTKLLAPAGATEITFPRKI